MQQMRRFKLDCEAKSDPKVEGKQVSLSEVGWPTVPSSDHED
jgi:hypothetical protein